MSSINLQESQLSGCATYVAIVVDESGSINGNEAQQIRDGLTSFINSQAQSNITLSLIGMSNSDTAVRPDNVIQKKISSNSQNFIDWINLYGLGNQSIQSDYWASGLNVAKNLSVTPDIVFVVTDGLQVNNSEYLKNLFTELNLTSKVFVYGVTSSFDTIEELTTPLTNFLERTPVLKNDQTSALDSDYIRVPDFSTLGNELNKLASNLSDLQIGCFPNVSIIDDNLVYPSLKKGLRISTQCGTLVLKNKSRIPLTLSAGTKIHKEKNLNGLIFKLDNSVTISGKSEVEVPIRIEGKPLVFGHFSTLVDLSDVFNPLGVSINFNIGRESSTIDISPEKTNLQSSYLQVVAAGSRGIDSTKGVHLRWMLNGRLGENHLPKGELYDGENSNSSFNKPDDFVKVYRAPYTKIAQTVNLTDNPNVVDNKKALWIYKTENPQRSVYVNFKDDKKYKSIKLSIDPLTNPVAFMQAYGNGLIEIETKTDLFFAVELDFSSSNTSKSVKLETLSVTENKITASKNVSSRKTYTSAQLNNKIRLVAENGRSIRFKANNCLLNAIQFEFYSDFITNANANGDWTLKGKYGLVTDDFKVFEQLEPKLNAVHGKWLKFNDGEYVNIKNYKAKWNRPTVADDITDENIKDIVLEYIELSKSDNPKAEKDIPFGDPVPINDPKDGEVQQYAENLTNISYLDILNIAANDYHVARMLGLGCLDIDEDVYTGEYVYLTEYTTFGSLDEDPEGKEVQHLSMSIPTSIDTERMPLPVQLNKIVPGLNVDSDENPNNRITNPEGYSFDGKKRFVSLFMDDIMDYDIVNPNLKNDFFKSSLEYEGSNFTFPVYLGIDHKIDSEKIWKSPELSHDVEYKSINQNLKESEFETVPINIPESGKSILNAIQEQTGKNTYIYQGYGINIFSRATSGRQISILSEIKSANNLMPPSNMNALLVTEENPLMFTSQSEQQLLGKITGADKTLVRIMFDYYSAQELLSYPVPREMTVTDAETDKESIFPDAEEILADHFKLYYKNGLPEVEYGEIESIVNNSTNNLTSIVKIREYRIISSGQQVKLGLDNSNKTRFERGVLTIGDQNYIIQNIEVKFKKDENSNDVFDYALIEVLKKEVTDKLHADGDATIDSEQIQDIKLPESRLCTLVQNMQTATNWHQPQIDFTINYPESLNKIHREVIEHVSQNGRDLQLEKTRGVWNDVVVERVFEDSYEMNENGTYKVDDEGNPIPLLSGKKHLGLYKIIFKNFNLPQHSQFKSEKENSVEWSNGIVRLFTKDAFEEGNPVPKKSRKEFKVYKTENIGTTGDLVLYIDDPDFKLGNYVTQTMAEGYDEILGAKNGLHIENGLPDYENDYVSQSANYYPSYKVYLYADAVSGITQENILPRENENTHYSVFGVSTHSKPDVCYKSKISIPCPMYAVKVEKTEKPEEIIGGSLYATRPDFYNRSTFTFTTKYDDSRKPYGLLHYRANDEDLFNVLYKPETVTTIREELNKLGGNDEIDFNNRWADFLNFNELATRGQYDVFPKNESEENYQFPLPDNDELIKLINDFIEWHNQTQGTQESTITSIASLNQVLISEAVQEPMLAVYFIEQAIYNAFVPLTEIPVIYEHIKGNDYVPVNKKQTIKDKNGNALKPTDTDFDIAPMMKVVNESQNRVQFTDFNLDGNSQNIYFYAVREMDIKMNFGEFSDLLGPVKLVASTPPKTPEIKRIMPILENQVLGINPAVQIELNAYQPEYKIRKINIYRATTMLEAQSIRTMKLAKEIVINEDTLSADFDNVWTVYDDFEDLEEVPFGDGLFYRITVSKQIEYADPESTTENPIINSDYAPSQPSKITATVIVDSISPESPVLEASGTVSGTNGEILKPVVFNWNKTVYNGKYHLYKMNSQGNWDKIHEISTNLENIALPLQQTKLNTDELIIKNEDGDRIYHHFKVISENTSGMLSSDEKILTL